MDVEKLPEPRVERRKSYSGRKSDSARKQSTAVAAAESQSKPASVEGQRLSQELLMLLQALQSMAPGSNKKQQYDTNDVLAAVEMFFDTILSQDHCSDALMTLIGMLQMPVLKSASRSDRFLTDTRHPARRLIKALFTAASEFEAIPVMATDGEEQYQKYCALLDIVKSVAHSYDGDDRLFLQAYFNVCQLQG